jgi:hypothetical protein
MKIEFNVEFTKTRRQKNSHKIRRNVKFTKKKTKWWELAPKKWCRKYCNLIIYVHFKSYFYSKGTKRTKKIRKTLGGNNGSIDRKNFTKNL